MSNKLNWKIDPKNIPVILYSTFGSASAISELHGYLLVDFERSKALGFNSGNIYDSARYMTNVLKITAEGLGLDSNEFVVTRKTTN